MQSIPAAKHRFQVAFNDGCPDSQEIQITYWFNQKGEVEGEAYFNRDDVVSPIHNGQFKHPYTELEYKLHVPSRFGKSKDALLDVLRWNNLGRSEPRPCTD